MPGQFLEIARLSAHHLYNLREVEQFVVVAQCHNWDAKRIAEATGYSVRTVEGMGARVNELIAHPLGYDRKGLLAGVWAFLHGECCLAQGWTHFEEATA